MSHSTQDAVARLQDTVADGRLTNSLYRQQQLAKLQSLLIKRESDLVNALTTDFRVTRKEAFVELFLTVSAIKSYLDQTLPQKELHIEYSVSRGQDASQIRQRIGIAIIEPQAHSFLFSTLSPLCAAVASGNAVLLVMKQNLRVMSRLLGDLLREALDPGIVEIVSSEPAEIPASIRANQAKDVKSPNSLGFSNKALSVAIVDRTSSLGDAAQLLWKARTSFGGTSPYAPDIIFVNEFAKDEFIDRLLKCAAELRDAYDESWKGHPEKSKVIDITDRHVLTDCRKLQERTFRLYPYRSLEDVVETVNSLSQEPNLATFAFGDAKSCKYILQFVEAEVGLANIIPIELLVGPAAPRGFSTNLSTRFSLDMFSVPRPQFAQATPLSSTLNALLRETTSVRDKDKLWNSLRPENRGPPKQDVGYFERGFLGAHWAASQQDAIEVSTNPKPDKSPVAYVHPDKYKNYVLNPDLSGAESCISQLRASGFNAKPNPNFNWIHDTYLILIRMFPKACPPTTIISMNAYFDPHYHMRVGLALRPLREKGYLLIGSGGAVHNLFRNVWDPMILYGDNFAQPTPPEPWALEFRQSVEDAIRGGGGPRLRKAITRLMKHPLYREAHATDDHFMPICFAAGAAGARDDEGAPAEFGAEDWELTNMCNSQYTIGAWRELTV
ncbi:hypothetical protein CDV31_006956 [Fusarium ambrosium]|uniref:Extradiol ring-cleavage dioxygenase class III enzyme subunit B domain-containing protein n=1 Tax=Fusarium ambrosium TaxID=131363 RepID=A0A428U9R5_9HYPO|nr:hypothetical protein CDV31_006956 [Fusarium ambrosium]